MDAFKSSLQKWRYGLTTSDKVLLGMFLLLSFAYVFYTHRQNANVFFESQFLHYEFLRELFARHITLKGFFTVYAEHLFPGYNLILALNVALFRYWGGFDSVVSGIFIFLTAALVVKHAYVSAQWPSIYRVGAAVFIALLLLSPTNNPMWGMALAALVGVCLFVLYVKLMEEGLWHHHKFTLPLFFIVFPTAQIFFLGAYGVGSVAALGILLFTYAIQHRKISGKMVAIAGLLFITEMAYLILITHYSALLANAPAVSVPNIDLMVKFVVIMAGASVLGQTFSAQATLLWPYYAVGILLIIFTLASWVHAYKRPQKGVLFMAALSIYAVVNIMFVALFRYRNGLGGAMGQWYNAHTHFLAVNVVYYLFSMMAERSVVKKLLSSTLLFILLLAAIAGYICDWNKAPAVPQWKEQFVAQAPVILAFPEMIHDKKDHFQTMLWDYDTVKPAIDFLYAHRLWIFNLSRPRIIGVTSDGWIEADKAVTVMCPAGTQTMKFHLWRKPEWPSSRVFIHANGKVKRIYANKDVWVNFDSHSAAIALIDASDEGLSEPMSSDIDKRKLVSILSDVECHS